jgi:hypothetical protein
MVTMISVFVFCWTPYAVLSLLGLMDLAEVSSMYTEGKRLLFYMNLIRNSLINCLDVFI